MDNSGERGLDAVQAESGIDATKDVARELDEMLMKPVRAMVGDATHLLLSPDSQLNTLPFAALVNEQDKYLVENYLITYLTSGRDLLRLQLNQNQDTSQPLLMANPTYSSEGVAVASADIKADKEDNTRGRRSGELGKSDDGTKDLMVEYYRRIQNGEARGEALRQVQLEMLKSEDRSHPFFWAAFIPSGSWLPLDSNN